MTNKRDASPTGEKGEGKRFLAQKSNGVQALQSMVRGERGTNEGKKVQGGAIAQSNGRVGRMKQW